MFQSDFLCTIYKKQAALKMLTWFNLALCLGFCQIGELRKVIKEAAIEEPYMGEQMPIRWLRFEQEMAKLVAEDTTHASYDQV